MINPFELNGKIYLVTGASSGIGRQTCISIANMGGRIIATGRNMDALEETITLLSGEGHSYIVADITKKEDRIALANQLPKINGVVHAAGVVKLVPVKFYNEADMEAMRLINYDAAFLLMQQIIKARLVLNGGSVVFVSSIAGLYGMKGNGIYAGTKAAMIATSRVLALEISNLKIRVNCVAPGMVRTPIIEQTATAISNELLVEDEKKYPLGYGNPEDVSNPIVFLLSDAAKWITGSTLILDGGRTCLI